MALGVQRHLRKEISGMPSSGQNVRVTYFAIKIGIQLTLPPPPPSGQCCMSGVNEWWCVLIK